MTTAVLAPAPELGLLENIRSRYGLDATTLKIIAVVLMFIDHIHQMFGPVGVPQWVNMPGRIVFPIFLFLMADSFHYTRNRKRFLTRLWIASVAMSIGSFLISAMFPYPGVVLMNNAFMTFLVAGLYMWFYDIIRDGVRNHRAGQIVKGILLCLVPIITAAPMFFIGTMAANPNLNVTLLRSLIVVASLIPNIVMVEGGFMMVVLAVAFYIFREYRLVQIGLFLALSAYILFANLANPNAIQWMMVFAIPFMLLYNGKPGRGMKDFFYVFYPAHIWILYIIGALLLSFGITHLTPYYANLFL